MIGKTRYFDHNATTPVAPEVLEAALPFLREQFGNPSSAHSLGRAARTALDGARRSVARALSVRPTEVLFTASGSEAICTALTGAVRASSHPLPHIVTSAVEHPATLLCAQALERAGLAEVTVVPVDRDGRLDVDGVLRAVRNETALVSLMLANNETGVVEPISDIARALAGRGPLLHVDAVQALGKIPVSVPELGCDLLTVSGHKVYAPKGAGALIVRRGVELAPLIPGHQERSRRGGTESMPAIVGFGAACERVPTLLAHADGLRAQRDRIEAALLRLPGSHVHSAGAPRVPGTLSVRFDGVDAESLLIHLDLHGIAASSGSACTTGDTRPSHVLLAMGLTPVEAHGALRLSLGEATSPEDVDTLLSILPGILGRLRDEQDGGGRIPPGSGEPGEG